MALEISLYVLASAALIWAAYSDIKTRRVPVVAGFGLLGVGLLFLLIGSLWIHAAFFLLAIWGSRGKIWSVPVAALGMVVLILGLMAMANDWWIVAYLFGGTILVAVVLSIVKRGGVMPAIKRLSWVFKNIGEEPDEEALRIPWGVLAAAAGLVYMWIWPGLVGGGT